MRRRLDTGNFQRQRQAVAPQPDRDFAPAMQPQTTAGLQTGRRMGPPPKPIQAPQSDYRPREPYPQNPQIAQPRHATPSTAPAQSPYQGLQGPNSQAAQRPQPHTVPSPEEMGLADIDPRGSDLWRTYTDWANGQDPNGNFFYNLAMSNGWVPNSGVPMDQFIYNPDGSLRPVNQWNSWAQQQAAQGVENPMATGQWSPETPWFVAGNPNQGQFDQAIAQQQAGNFGWRPPSPDDIVAPQPPGFEGVPMPGYQRPETNPQFQGPGQRVPDQGRSIPNPNQSGQGYSYAQLEQMFQNLNPRDRAHFLQMHPRFAQTRQGGGPGRDRGGMGGTLPGPGNTLNVNDVGGIIPMKKGGAGGSISGGTGGSLPGPGQGAAPAPTPNPAPNPGASTLTLSPQAEAARRALEDELSATLASIGVARDQIPATLNLVTTRLLNDQAEDLRNTDETANARGIYNSGIRSTDRGRVTSGYDRKRSDLASDAARQLSELASAESGAHSSFNRSWADILLQLARDAAADPNYGVGSSDGAGNGKGKNNNAPGIGKGSVDGKIRRGKNKGKKKNRRGNR